MSDERDISRRELFRGKFLANIADALTGSLADSLGADSTEPPATADPASPRHARSFPVHRPPGAIDEPSFLRDCTRCDACLEACPHDAIIHAPPRMRDAAGTPVIDAARQPCMMCDDLPCIPACEPGVLSPDLPVKMGEALIVEQTCLAHQGTFCTVCSEHCPVEGAIALDEGKPRIVTDRCTGCGVCHFVCPAPSNAVITMPARERPARPAAAAAPTPAADDPDRVIFPPMNDAMLAEADVRQLFEDLRDHAEVLDVRIKGAAQAHVEGPATLDDARAAVETRSARGVQIRYAYDDAQWCDTLMLLGEGVRLIRVRQLSDQAGPALPD